MVTLGVDEVGRGCWAGPLVAGAVALKAPIPGLRDSKKLSKKLRQEIAVVIQSQALSVSLGWVEPAEIDSLGLTKSVRLAMERAVAQIQIKFDEIIVDGNFNFLANDPRSKAIIKADETVPSVSAASIIAKVARDAFMLQAALRYPEYGFEKHVGYGTAFHLAALKRYSTCALHRRSYRPIKAIITA
ncbi:MAG: ribonuclease HII [Candidatus Saccharimonadales bacterium]